MTRFAIPALAAATAIAAAPLWAQDTAIDPGNLILADDLDGAEIYSDFESGNWAEEPSVSTIGDDWKPIGHIEDVVLDMNGDMYGIVADIGGFLGIGDRHVLFEMNNVMILPKAEGSDDYQLAVRATQEELEAMPEVEKGWLD
ncbi:PRC-barrel domain-containing protein [Mangrovicoccus algicola]|uniref:PRC-barrel domain-containing protein n=1 Tax=Mangrovicoccus algicola TaxID=2771008 RepID=A0A8J6YT06_9RHOB|nr:PRC-barrel domain-containing protein [Mangrovicoccus algicola]MBE3638628.1 PRC-barrel domain-containing protein [Mangrovicoccus algicola]